MLHIADRCFKGHSYHLSDEAYAGVLDNIVVSCVDCAVIHRASESIFLGKRRDEPAKDEMWIMGGRMKVGVEPRQTIREILKREIDLEVSSNDEIKDLNFPISYVWENRSQPPQDRGCHMVGLYFAHFVSDSVRNQLEKLPPNDNFSEFA